MHLQLVGGESRRCRRRRAPLLEMITLVSNIRGGFTLCPSIFTVVDIRTYFTVFILYANSNPNSTICLILTIVKVRGHGVDLAGMPMFNVLIRASRMSAVTIIAPIMEDDLVQVPRQRLKNSSYTRRSCVGMGHDNYI